MTLPDIALLSSPAADSDPEADGRWLTVAGIGEDGVEGLSPAAARAIARAAHVFGGERHLRLAAGLVRGVAHVWPRPFDVGLEAVLALRHAGPVCVLASGDPFCFGVGATLARLMRPREMLVLPAPSAFSLAAARLGWALQETETLSIHGRPVGRLRPLLHPGRRVLALTGGGEGPAEVGALLARLGLGGSRMTVLERLGGSQERIVSLRAAEAADRTFDVLNVVALEVVADETARPLALTPGLDDDLFRHDGQITKRAVRALTLCALAPLRGQLLWDIGAGSGSVGIEWLLRDPSVSAIAIEADPQRAARARANAEELGVPHLRVVEGRAPDALAGLPAPDAIFVGGGGRDPAVMAVAMAALRPGGRLVANAVTLELEAVLLSLHASHGGDLTRLSLSRAGAVGGLSGWRPAMPLTSWTWVRPLEPANA